MNNMTSCYSWIKRAKPKLDWALWKHLRSNFLCLTSFFFMELTKWVRQWLSTTQHPIGNRWAAMFYQQDLCKGHSDHTAFWPLKQLLGFTLIIMSLLFTAFGAISTYRSVHNCFSFPHQPRKPMKHKSSWSSVSATSSLHW